MVIAQRRLYSQASRLSGGPHRPHADIIDRILAHLREKEQEAPARPLLVPPTRAPPATLSLFAGTELNQQGRH